MKNREKAEITNIVEDGVTLFVVDGRYKAAHFMLQNGVRFPVIVRVLAPGGRRRQSGRRAV